MIRIVLALALLGILPSCSYGDRTPALAPPAEPPRTESATVVTSPPPRPMETRTIGVDPYATPPRAPTPTTPPTTPPGSSRPGDSFYPPTTPVNGVMNPSPPSS